jgi:hypothetical protein
MTSIGGGTKPQVVGRLCDYCGASAPFPCKTDDAWGRCVNAVVPDPHTSEQVMVDMIRADLVVTIDPQAWRMFIRHRFERISTLAHRIHDGKR